MALICMAVYDTQDNGRTEFTEHCLFGLLKTVDFFRHRLILVDNGSCDSTQDLYRRFQRKVVIAYEGRTGPILIRNERNVGTANAVNQALKYREAGEYAVKMDNDCVVLKAGWLDEMEDVIKRMPQIGVLGLKRVDLMESPSAINTDQRSRLLMVPHETGQRWRVVEDCKQVMGTCTMINPALLEKVGYFYQCDGLYGFDDSLMCIRSNVAGFMNCFLHGIDIDHIDPGGTEYTKWKAKYAGEMLDKFAEQEKLYRSEAKSVYYNPFEK